MVYNLDMFISGTVQNVNIVHIYFKKIQINHTVSIFRCVLLLFVQNVFALIYHHNKKVDTFTSYFEKYQANSH